jgi:polyhydroxybutyrate depolymerase
MKEKFMGIFIVTLLIITAMPSFGAMIEQKSIIYNNQVFINENTLTNTETSVLPHEIITIRHHLLKRSYLLYVPTSYDGATPVPLVVVFHGGGNTPENASERFGVSEKAEEEGFIVVYPNASEIMLDGWNIGYGWYTTDFFGEIGRLWVDELGYTKKIVAKTQKNYNIDPDRIYLAGHSNGAMMAYYFAAKFSNKIAAIASNGGCIGGHVKDYKMVMIPEPKNPVSIAIFHGRLDPLVPYNGGWDYKNSFYCTSVAEAVSFWVEHNGCNTEPMTNDTFDITIDRYSGGNAGTEVLVYSLKHKGHIWFGGPPWEDPNPVISTTDEMWEFFKTHPKQ